MKSVRSVELLEKFISYAIAHGEASLAGDHELANQSFVGLSRAVRSLTRQGERGQLVKILDHENASVRCWAATLLLPTHEQLALSRLRTLAGENIACVSFDASIVLREWARGALKMPC